MCLYISPENYYYPLRWWDIKTNTNIKAQNTKELQGSFRWSGNTLGLQMVSDQILNLPFWYLRLITSMIIFGSDIALSKVLWLVTIWNFSSFFLNCYYVRCLVFVFCRHHFYSLEVWFSRLQEATIRCHIESNVGGPFPIAFIFR